MAKINVTELYKKEKVISHTDIDGNTAEVKLVKMSPQEVNDCLENTDKAKDKALEELLKTKKEFFVNQNKSLSKEKLVEFQLIYERGKYQQLKDLAPIEKLDGMDKKEAEKIEKEWIEKQVAIRQGELLKMSHEDLLELYVTTTLERLAMLKANVTFGNYRMYFMVRDIEKGERIFKSPESVQQQIRDQRVLNWLNEEINKFSQIETEKDKREAAESKDFLLTGK